jgi:hypothetical protein
MKIHVSIKSKNNQWMHVRAESVHDARILKRDLKEQGVTSEIFWQPDTATEMLREIKKGRYWTSRLWHWMNLPSTKTRAKAARRYGKIMDLA